LSPAHLQQITKIWIHDEGDLLKFKSITPTSLPHQYAITLTEGKKRHIRRVMKALWYHLLDLQRIKEGAWELGDLAEGKRKIWFIS
jgi:16S rRNA U516 pseudouridylate synthase RsuA-like enzyme